MKFLYFGIIAFLIALSACSSMNYYETEQPVSISTNMAKEYFVMQAPLIFEGMGYAEEEASEENGKVVVSKFVELGGKKVKLYFDLLHKGEEISITPYFIEDNQKKYIDKEKHPEEIKETFLKDMERFINISQSQSFPNRP